MKTYFKPSISILACESLGAKMQGTGNLFIACGGQPNCDYGLGANCYGSNDQYNMTITIFSNSLDWSGPGGCLIYVNGQAIAADEICSSSVLDPSCSFPLNRQGDIIEGAIYEIDCNGSGSVLPCHSTAPNTIEWSCDGSQIPCSDNG